MPHLPILQKPALRVHWLVPKQPNSSRNRAQHAFPAQRPECLTLRTDALKKQSLCHTYLYCRNQLWESLAGSETAEQQQESCPTCLASTAPRMSNIAYWRRKKTKLMPHLPILQKQALRVHWLVPKQPNSSRNRAQHAFPAQRPECLTLRTDALKKQSLCHTYLSKTSFESPLAGSETAEQQQESCPICLPSTAPRMSNVAYWRPKKTKLLPHLPIKNHLWESIGWFRNSRTAAGIVPNMSSQHSAPNV